jgi:hypothetical protein
MSDRLRALNERLDDPPGNCRGAGEGQKITNAAIGPRPVRLPNQRTPRKRGTGHEDLHIVDGTRGERPGGPRFSRCRLFIIYDDVRGEHDAEENTAGMH